jgi:hypothetical protein
MRVGYTPELIAHIRHRYENTDDTLAKIAIDTGVSERAINRMRDREGWPRRSDAPVRDLPPAMRCIQEMTAALRAQAPAPPPLKGEGDDAPVARSTIDRIEQLVEQELAAEEAARAQLGGLARPPREAERTARTLAVLTQTLHALQRLRCGLSPNARPDDDDDLPHDIDEFRLNLARRIDAFVASQTEPDDAGGDPGSAPLDGARA